MADRAPKQEEIDFPAPEGYIMPWLGEEENIPPGWQMVDALRGKQVPRNPGNPTSPTVPGVWIQRNQAGAENKPASSD